MKILLAADIFSQWFSCGQYFLKAFSELGHYVNVWDYRFSTSDPCVSDYDFLFAYKGDRRVAKYISSLKTSICYYPDAFERDPDAISLLQSYSKVFTTIRPAPQWMEWFPTGWDPDIHRTVEAAKVLSSVFVGTSTPRKQSFLDVMRPTAVFGNGWGEGVKPVYLWEYQRVLSASSVLINVHRNDIGLNSRLFEMMATGFTITDIVPGVREVLGDELTNRVGFTTPEQGRERLEYFLSHPEERDELWYAERKAIRPYTYLECAKRVLECAA